MKKLLSALGLLALFLMPVGAFAADADPAAQNFVANAIRTDNSEIMLGQLAKEKGETESVKAYGDMLVTDHRKAREDMMPLAKELGVTPSDEPKPEAKADHDKLAALSGEDFDREFLNAMITAHQKNIELFQAAADAGNAASAVAAKRLPTLKKHLELAQALQGTP